MAFEYYVCACGKSVRVFRPVWEMPLPPTCPCGGKVVSRKATDEEWLRDEANIELACRDIED